MTTKMIRFALHLVDVIISSPALKCSVSGRDFSCMCGWFYSLGITALMHLSVLLPLWLGSSQFYHLRLYCKFLSLSCNSCHSPQVRLSSPCVCVCEPFFCSLQWTFQKSDKSKKKRITEISKICSGCILTLLPCGSQVFRILLCSSEFLKYFWNVIHTRFEWPIDWHPVFLRSYGRLCWNQ